MGSGPLRCCTQNAASAPHGEIVASKVADDPAERVELKI
jgi:hypothetical protein